MTVINANALSMDDSQEESLTGATPTLSPEKPKTPRSSQQDQDRTIPFTLSPPDEELSPPHSLAPAALARAHPTVFKTKAMATDCPHEDVKHNSVETKKIESDI